MRWGHHRDLGVGDDLQPGPWDAVEGGFGRLGKSCACDGDACAAVLRAFIGGDICDGRPVGVGEGERVSVAGGGVHDDVGGACRMGW